MKAFKLLFLLFLSINACTSKITSNEEKNNEEINLINNYNEIKETNISLIQTGEFKPLKLLEQIDRIKYDILINYFSEKNIDEYYFTDNNKYFLSENRNINFENGNIGYTIFHYDAFTNKYHGWRGNTTGKFSVLFNNKSEIIGIYSFR